MKLDDFLITRIAEDEEMARAAGSRGLYAYEEGGGDGWAVEGTDGSEGAIIGDRALAEHIARHDPARVLADCAAKRAIVELHAHVEGCGCLHNDQGLRFGCRICHEDQGYILSAGWCDTLLALARVYADHPNFESPACATGAQ